MTDPIPFAPMAKPNRYHIQGDDGSVTWYWDEFAWDVDPSTRFITDHVGALAIAAGIHLRNSRQDADARIEPRIVLED